MRIIGGKYKRRRFDVPKNFNARPTTDFAKENLFNVLGQYLDFEGIVALDLFSGTGSISAELVSRGAEQMLSLELRRQHTVFIRSVISALGEEARWRVLQADVLRYLKSRGQGQSFDFIFADPPFVLAELPALPDMIREANILKPRGLFVLEHPRSCSFATHPFCMEHRAYGSVNFSFFSFSG